MRILIDECTPRLVKVRLAHLGIRSVQEMGWAGMKDGDLLDRAEAQFDVFITTDQNLRFQQNLSRRKLGTIVLPSNRLPIVTQLIDVIEQAVQASRPGIVIEIPMPRP